MQTPSSVRDEHAELHRDLTRATQEAGRVGEVARTLATIMHPHLAREDEYATPPLALLKRIVTQGVTPDMASVLPLVGRLRSELPLMIEEHRAIEGALEELSTAAEREGCPEYVEFAERLLHHLRAEEQVFYPAALLVGTYVEQQLRR